jgi:hypothetical protein
MVVGVVGTNDPAGAPPVGAHEPPEGDPGVRMAVTSPPKFVQESGTGHTICEPPVQAFP